MKDVISVEGYENHLKGTPKAVEAMLELFEKYDVHVTWATIGYLFCKDVKELQANYPTLLPNISLKSLVFPRNQYAILEKILIHFKKLESNYEYKSCTMKEISTLLEY
jgi:5'(3')-deoxyribonucleotidase